MSFAAVVQPAADMVLAWGELRHVSEWSLLCGLSARLIEDRIALGMAAELAMSLPNKARVSLDVPPGYPGSWTWHGLSYEDDDWAQTFVQNNPDGATCESVAEALGLTRDFAWLIEQRAIAKLERRHGKAMLRKLLGGCA